MFTQIETVDLLDAGPEAPAGVADAADAWGAPVSAALHRGLCVSLVRMTGACGGAARQLESGVIDVGEGDAPPEAMQVSLCVCVCVCVCFCCVCARMMFVCHVFASMPCVCM